MNENTPKLKFKNEYALLRFTFFLKKNNIMYEINDNEVFISPDIDIMEPRFENGRSIYDSYKWYVETFKPKPFYKLRKWFNNVVDSIHLPKWLLLGLCLILMLSISGRMALDKFENMSLGQKIESVKKVVDTTQDISNTIDNVKETTENTANKFFIINNDKNETEIIPPKQEIKLKGNNSFAVLFVTMLVLLTGIASALGYSYRNELLTLWKKK